MSDEVVEQISEQDELETKQIEKEGAAREYSQEYIQELIAESKKYMPPTVWDHLHRKARSKAGGRVSGKARSAASAAASTEATNTANAEAVTQPPEVEAQLQTAREQTHKADKEEMIEIEKSITAEDKSKLSAEVKSKSTADLTAYLRRIHMQAAQGHLLAGFSQADMNWFAGQIGQELKSKAEAKGGESSAGAPLKWGAVKTAKEATPEELKEYEQVGKCSFNAVDDIRERESESSKKEATAEKGGPGSGPQGGGESSKDTEARHEAMRGMGMSEKEIEVHDAEAKANANASERQSQSQRGGWGGRKTAEVEKAEPMEPFVGSQPLITFVAASPGVIESLRKEALVGPAGRIFDEQYLKPLGITRDDISITYLIPRLLKDEAGKVREPTTAEIAKETSWRDEQQARREAPSEPITVALGHTVKKTLGDVDITLPHPNALGMPRTDEELIRKREQLNKMIQAKLNYLEYGELRKRLMARK